MLRAKMKYDIFRLISDKLLEHVIVYVKKTRGTIRKRNLFF